MTLLRSYIVRRFIASFCVVMPAIVLSIWMVEALNQIKLIVRDGFSVSSYFKVILVRLAITADIALPLASFVTAYLTLARLNADREINAVHAVGGSPLQLLRPAVDLSLLMLIPALLLSAVIVPLSYQKFKDIQNDAKSELFLSRITPGKFTDIGDDVTVYVHSRDQQTVRNIIVSDKRSPNTTATISSETGTYQIENNEVLISFYNGVREVYDHSRGQSEFLNFKNFQINLGTFHQATDAQSRRIRGAQLSELFFTTQWPQEDALAEIHRRLAKAFLPMSLIFIAFAALTYRAVSERAQTSLKQRALILATVVGAIGIQIGYLTLMNLQKNSVVSSEVLYVVSIGPGVAVFAITFIFCWRSRMTPKRGERGMLDTLSQGAPLP